MDDKAGNLGVNLSSVPLPRFMLRSPNTRPSPMLSRAGQAPSQHFQDHHCKGHHALVSLSPRAELGVFLPPSWPPLEVEPTQWEVFSE